MAASVMVAFPGVTIGNMTQASLFCKGSDGGGMAGLIKRSVNLAGHATSMALEPEFWAVLDRMAADRSFASLIVEIDARRGERPLASACRVAALNWTQAQGAL